MNQGIMNLLSTKQNPKIEPTMKQWSVVIKKTKNKYFIFTIFIYFKK